jgi:phosphoglycolate phosphatase
VWLDEFSSLVFDFDGTLVDSNNIKREMFFEVSKHLLGSAKELTIIFEEKLNWTRKEIFQELANSLCPAAERVQVAQQLMISYGEGCFSKISAAPEIHGAHDLLEKLSAENINVFISSATPIEDLTSLVKARNLGCFIKSSFGAPTTKEQHLREIASASTCPRDQILMVGDADTDEFVAKNFGCQFVRVAREKCERIQEMGAVKNLEELSILLFK